jgi:hypothetical protein
MDDYNNKRLSSQIELTEPLKNAIKTITARHAGLLCDSIKHINNRFANKRKSSSSTSTSTSSTSYLSYDENIHNTYTDDDVLNFMISAQFLDYFANCRVLPQNKDLFEYFKGNYIEILLFIVANSWYPEDISNNYISRLIYKGIITQSYTLSANYTGNSYTFSSPLVKNLFHYKYISSQGKSIKAKHWDVKDLYDFIKITLSNMNPFTLMTTKAKHNDGFLLERAWQMEFYRAAFTLLPTNEHTISPDVGYIFGIGGGKVDFNSPSAQDNTLCYYINDSLKWMIELMRESDKDTYNKHINKFKQGGLYENMVKQVNSWIILDFRRNFPNELEDDVFYIVYNKDFSTYTIIVKDNTNLNDYTSEEVIVGN